jgi:hypothetical protein
MVQGGHLVPQTSRWKNLVVPSASHFDLEHFFNAPAALARRMLGLVLRHWENFPRFRENFPSGSQWNVWRDSQDVLGNLPSKGFLLQLWNARDSNFGNFGKTNPVGNPKEHCRFATARHVCFVYIKLSMVLLGARL